METIQIDPQPMSASASAKTKRDAGSFLSTSLPVIVVLCLVVFLAYQLAVLTWRAFSTSTDEDISSSALTEVSQSNSSASDVSGEQLGQQVANLHLFGIAGQVTKTKKVVAPTQETRLNLQLHGVFVDDDPELGSAIIGQSGGEQKFYNVEDEISQGAVLAEVHPSHVIISRNGRQELLRFPKTSEVSFQSAKSEPAPDLSDGGPSLAEMRERFKSDPATLFEQVSFVPVRSGNGSLKGYRLLPKGDRELYDRLGVRPSDLIKSVNGISLENDQQSMKVLKELSTAKQLTLDVIRRGVEETLSVNLN